MTPAAREGPRRGRLPTDERQARRDAILDHALDELVELGVDRLTMLGVARRAGASKETLYSWFENRNGLLTALIERNAEGALARVRAAVSDDGDARGTLVAFATGLLALLTSRSSIALNRAAMSSDELAELLLRSGRHRVGPVVEDYLATLHRSSAITAPRPAAAFELLYGLVIQDTQIRVLLGDAPPTEDQISRHAELAVDRFLALCR